MKTWVIAVVVAAVLASAACAQLTPRSVAMGSTGVGLADDGAAWFQNPAGLAALDITCVPDQRWGADVIAGATRVDEHNGGGVTVSAWQPTSRVGVGAGYGDVDDTGRTFGLGVGTNYQDSDFSVGLSYTRIDPFGPKVFDELNLGFMFRFEQPCKDPIRIGLLVRDLNNDTCQGPFVDFGFSWPATNALLLAADVRDLTDEIDLEVNGGLEYTFGCANEWTARAGLHDTVTDTNLCLGAGYRWTKDWRIDAAWEDRSSENTWVVSAGFTY